MTNIALIGCTGSIGRQTAEVVRRYPEQFRFSSLVAGSDGAGLSSLSAEFSPEYSACACGEGEEDLLARAFEGADVAFIAAGGFAGLKYTLEAARRGMKIALANKESLVCGGELVMREISRTGAELVPVDSEHSALFQALGMRRDAPFRKLILTASGGPFYGFPKERLARVTAADALRHPTWKMGAKITVDSATLLNKGYEVIEAKWLYRADYSQIQAVVHPESIVHSLVEFEDGGMLAQLGYPDMRLPIQLALTCPERTPCLDPLDLTALGALHFYPMQTENFPCFTLAVEAGKAGGTLPAVLNGAGEEAVKAFLGGSISFPQIAETIEDALNRIPRREAESYEAVAEADEEGRRAAKSSIYGK